jgi:SAM-dependent MidA family methyltransferase
MLHELGTRCFEDLAVMHAARAYGLARSTIETQLHFVSEHGIEQIQSSLGDRLHEPDPAAR